MSFKITPARWLKVEADRIQAIIEMPRYWRRTWTPEELRAELASTQKLEYTLREIQVINDELHTRGVVEDVPAPEPALEE